MRRLLLVNALIFAVLASAVGLAYYGYSYTSEVSTREREIIQDTMRDLAEEKVIGIESLITSTDDKVFAEVARAIELDRLRDDLQTIAGEPLVESIYVLDDRVAPVLDGLVSRRTGDERLRARTLFLTAIAPSLPLRDQPLNVRGHVHGTWEGRPYLFSFAKKQIDDRTYYVVVETNLTYLFINVFPEFFPRSPRLYQVVDQDGLLRYGFDFAADPSNVVIEQPFNETFDKWRLRVAQKDVSSQERAGRRQILDFVLIGGSLAVILAGLGVLALAIRRERRANELKSEFISNVSHELKTPLSIISMFGELLALGRVKSPAQGTEYAEIIWRESVRLARLIDNVLDFAKIERGVDAYEFTDADVGEVVARAIELSQHRLAKAEMTIEAELDPELPPVRLDPNAFTLAVLNLIDNAIKYAPDGKKIAITLKHLDDRVVLRVRDWGQGIEPDEQARIFERFYRARAVRLKPIRGSGIGLALVEHIVQAHHGTVSCASTPGQGATFTISLPVPSATAVRGRTVA
ncbi:MAG TPA: HAMP domain-containing sensor histidine kinase [Kofleriaceae bacterium]|jgi:two-component system phosphate regulon sensor histidine kinase PhoR|nr:HAMP domain-containing sensor histidine kinase [Kofleriaceae bacterium]